MKRGREVAETVFETDVREVMEGFKKLRGVFMRVSLRDFMLKRAAGLLAQVKISTPVDTGRLRREWKLRLSLVSDDAVEVEIYNPVEYAEHIEKGHRVVTKDGRVVGYVAGRFMLDSNLTKLDRSIVQELEAFIESECRRLGVTE